MFIDIVDLSGYRLASKSFETMASALHSWDWATETAAELFVCAPEEIDSAEPDEDGGGPDYITARGVKVARIVSRFAVSNPVIEQLIAAE